MPRNVHRFQFTTNFVEVLRARSLQREAEARALFDPEARALPDQVTEEEATALADRLEATDTYSAAVAREACRRCFGGAAEEASPEAAPAPARKKRGT